MTPRIPTNPAAEKKVGSTELAETLSKFNYNQYVEAPGLRPRPGDVRSTLQFEVGVRALRFGG